MMEHKVTIARQSCRFSRWYIVSSYTHCQKLPRTIFWYSLTVTAGYQAPQKVVQGSYRQLPSGRHPYQIQTKISLGFHLDRYLQTFV